jgi:hypothetical protein
VIVAGNLLHPLGDLGHREVLVAVVHGFELAADNRDNGSSEQTFNVAQMNGREVPDDLLWLFDGPRQRETQRLVRDALGDDPGNVA